MQMLNSIYGIKGIQIAPDRSQANGKIERLHWDVRQALFKAANGVQSKWSFFVTEVMWADRVTVRKRLGCSPYFALTARALTLHTDQAKEIMEKIDQKKQKDTLRYEKLHAHTIKNFDFKPGELVLVRNSQVENSLSAKMLPRWMGPCIVIRRTEGGACVIAEMDGAAFQNKISLFRSLPALTGISMESLDKIANGPEPEEKEPVEIDTENLANGSLEIEYENDDSITETMIRGEEYFKPDSDLDT
ncbi:hypothetical protein GGU10DRAFT_397934 [Lentinula aff. detonsa]|uniref:Integrase catalytic domain-containing protein n=1 Tax=Lentinula aff. detonsa TaxID=2804958 RepID=A0AA38KME5_9AGAR|nr:hypothetical protein GGU10DRAFT_397934 [Lentinula aff. detonsa]